MDHKTWKHLKNRSKNGRPTESGNRKIARRLAKHKMQVSGFKNANKQMAKKDGDNNKLWVIVLKDKKIPLKKLVNKASKKKETEA